ncbi:Rap1-interacting factor 1 N terminal-domain-containing protein [Gaertneriomyces semiglobifer]|nr:Rap1-interacting factor 1 N terminal-domain-containing protein [Gaertneriomyces semiglobifer]
MTREGSLEDFIACVVEDPPDLRFQGWIDLREFYKAAISSKSEIVPIPSNKVSSLLTSLEQDLRIDEDDTELWLSLNEIALQCSGIFLAHPAILPDATLVQLSEILTAVLDMLESRKDDGPWRGMAVRTLVAHHIEDPDTLASIGPLTLHALVKVLQQDVVERNVEGMAEVMCAALAKLFQRSPELAVAQCSVWVPPSFPLLLVKEAKIYNVANLLFETVAEHFVNVDEKHDQAVKTFVKTQGETLVAELRTAMETSHANVMAIWSHLVLLLGTPLHRTNLLNSLLKIIETQFNSVNVNARLVALKAWRRLILNFRQKDHLFHPKRTNLTLLPLINSFKYERQPSVRTECMKTWIWLVIMLSHSSKPNELDFVNVMVKPVMGYLKTEKKLRDYFILAMSTPLSRTCPLCCASTHTVDTSLAFTVSSPTEFTDATLELRSLLTVIDQQGILRRIQGFLPSTVWKRETFDMYMEVLLMATERCTALKQIWARLDVLFSHITDYVNDCLKSDERDFQPLHAVLQFLWQHSTNQQTSAYICRLCCLFRIICPMRSPEKNQKQFAEAKMIMHLIINLMQIVTGDKALVNLRVLGRSFSLMYGDGIAAGTGLHGGELTRKLAAAGPISEESPYTSAAGHPLPSTPVRRLRSSTTPSPSRRPKRTNENSQETDSNGNISYQPIPPKPASLPAPLTERQLEKMADHANPEAGEMYLTSRENLEARFLSPSRRKGSDNEEKDQSDGSNANAKPKVQQDKKRRRVEFSDEIEYRDAMDNGPAAESKSVEKRHTKDCTTGAGATENNSTHDRTKGCTPRVSLFRNHLSGLAENVDVVNTLEPSELLAIQTGLHAIMGSVLDALTSRGTGV